MMSLDYANGKQYPLAVIEQQKTPSSIVSLLRDEG